MKITKKILSFALALIMTFSIIPIMDLGLEASAATFVPRLTAPTRTGYYSNNTSTNPYSVNTSRGGGNCVWYAWGRAYEILGSRPKINTIGNACTWYPNNKSSGNYSYGSTPKLGAIICWSGGSSGAGHVAVVEQINSDGSFVISESSWTASDWWFNVRTLNSSGYYGAGLHVQGYIYLGDYGGVSVPSCTCSSSYKGNYICTTSQSNLNIRSGHGTGYSVVGSIPSGATVSVSKADGTWAHVTYNGISGYASMQYLSKQCVHSYSEGYEAAHPHKIYMKCSLCGHYYYTNNTKKISSCSQCVPRYTISFNANGGSCSTSSKTVTYGSTYGTLPTPTKTGHTFAGWYTATSGGTKITSSSAVSITSNQTLYAHWTAYTYTVSYNANGGSNAPASQTKTYGKDLILTSDIPKGKTYTVTYNANGGTADVSSKTYSQTFENWFGTIDGLTGVYNSGDIYSKNASTVLYARWSTVNFDYQVPIRAGYYFMGWYDSKETDSDGLPIGKKYENHTDINGNVTVYAMWGANTNPSLFFGDANLNAQIDIHDATRLVKMNAGLRDYTLDEMFRLDMNGNGYLDAEDVELLAQLNAGIIDIESIPIFLHYRGIKIKSYPQTTYNYGETFDSTGLVLSSIMSNGVEHLLYDYTISGYDPYKIGTQTISVNYYLGTLYLTVTVLPPECYVYFNANGGSVEASGQEVTYSDTYGTLPTPKRPGCSFEGWYTSATGGTKITSSSTVSTMANHTLYAHWKEVSTTISSNALYNAVVLTGGEEKYYKFTPLTSDTYVIYSTGSDDTRMYLYDLNGNQFDGDDDDGEGRNFRLECNLVAGTTYIFGVRYYSSSTTGTISFTLGEIYTISYDANGGTGEISSQIKDFGSSATLSSTKPTRVGYDFKGWSTTPTSTNAQYFSGRKFETNENVTLYAVWEECEVSSVEIKTTPLISTYYVGDIFNMYGLTLTVTYSDSSTKDIEYGFVCSHSDFDTPGTHEVTVAYKGKTTTFDVNVVELQATAESGVVIDEENNLIFGVDEYVPDIESNISVVGGDAVIELTPTENGYGTGSKITVMSGELELGVYTLVIFGDVNGDGIADTEDATIFATYSNFENLDYYDRAELFKAADINGDGAVDNMDEEDMYAVANFEAYIDQKADGTYRVVRY